MTPSVATCDTCGATYNLWRGSRLPGKRCTACREGTILPGSALDQIDAAATHAAKKYLKPIPPLPANHYEQLVATYGLDTANRIRAMEKAEARFLRKIPKDT